MSIKLGNTSIGALYLGSTKIAQAYLGSTKIYESRPSLPAYTIRLKFTEGTTPTFSSGTAVQVSSSPNVWDLTYTNTDWSSLCINQGYLIEVIDANTSSVTNMNSMFRNCQSLTTVPLFNTSSVTDMSYMLYNCNALTTVPLFDTSSVTNMSGMLYHTDLTTVPLFDTSGVTNMSSMLSYCPALTTVPLFDTSSVTKMSRMFYYCTRVQSGALALYQQASTQSTPPTKHGETFAYCGSDTTSGADELAQIPTDWGGTMA